MRRLSTRRPPTTGLMDREGMDRDDSDETASNRNTDAGPTTTPNPC